MKGAHDVASLRRRAVAALERGEAALDSYALVFCKNYVTTAPAYLSYLEWDRERLQQALGASPVPVTVIYGQKDNRVERAWLESLRGGPVGVLGVPGADHFFDLAHEFELLDGVVQVITEDDHG